MSDSPTTLIYRFVFVAVLTTALIILDHQTSYFNSARRFLSNINTPFNHALTLPVQFHAFVNDYWPNRKLRERITKLELENQHLNVKAQKYDALEIEKNRLLVLFSAKQVRGKQSVKMARIIRTYLQGAYDQRILVDQGMEDNVELSQPVVDANGVIGQVSKLARDHSVVTVITDSSHAVPVEVLRNGLNAVARGQGGGLALSLPFLSFQADIEVGDVLVTSGLGGVFPVGHPVAEVVDIKGIAGEQFLTVLAKPFAELDKIKNILLLEHKETIQTRRAEYEPIAPKPSSEIENEASTNEQNKPPLGEEGVPASNAEQNIQATE